MVCVVVCVMVRVVSGSAPRASGTLRASSKSEERVHLAPEVELVYQHAGSPPLSVALAAVPFFL
jgi:hypothetical protein